MALRGRVRPKRLRWRKRLAAASFLAAMLSVAGHASPRPVKDEGDPASSVHLRAQRETDDLGSRWILTRDPVHPGAPGRWCRLAEEHRDPGTPPKTARVESQSTAATRPVVIHGGDRLIVVDHSAVVEARFDAVALDAAIVGAESHARLRFNGKIVRVVAVGPGRATLAAVAGVQP